MAGPATVMREVHRLKRLTRDLQEQIDRGPRQLKALQAKVTRQEGNLRDEQDAIKKLKVSVHEKEVSLRTSHTQIAKYQKQLAESSGKKEYDALQNEIATTKAQCSQLEDEILLGMAEGEERTAKLPELEKNIKLAKEEAAKFEKGTAERNATLTADLSEAQQKLKDAEAAVPPEIRTQYDRIVTAMGADAFAAVAGRSCSACQTGLIAQNYNELLLNMFVVCKSCGRILYLPE